MNRRGFFAALAGAAAGVVVGPELAELLAPKRTIFLPPAGGWLGANRLLLTSKMITDEALCVLGMNIEFAAKQIPHVYDAAFIDGELWRFGPVMTELITPYTPPFAFNRININRPPRYASKDPIV